MTTINPEQLRESANELSLMLIAFRTDPRVAESLATTKQRLFEAADRIEELERDK